MKKKGKLGSTIAGLYEFDFERDELAKIEFAVLRKEANRMGWPIEIYDNGRKASIDTRPIRTGDLDYRAAEAVNTNGFEDESFNLMSKDTDE